MDKTNSTSFRTGLSDVEIPLFREGTQCTDEELKEDPNAQTREGKLVPSMLQGQIHL